MAPQHLIGDGLQVVVARDVTVVGLEDLEAAGGFPGRRGGVTRRAGGRDGSDAGARPHRCHRANETRRPIPLVMVSAAAWANESFI